ncbi:carbohydrate ABC transporter permease [Paenibacillus sp. YN15]|uniref:carbohydrate ABC transporter permease n=1 Tax=Paenibacillus sp. YN15 TaxID=1742774 RepID=UPI000DCE5EF9|nr:carbohydrate ABC transporter permease [Paenibacillus sp. YN15]RAV05471.1 carbohydrate ABC transporter permease [Paenibacillus sp. YN15]
MNISRGEKQFRIVNYGFLAILALLTLYPFVYVLSASLSSSAAVASGEVVLLPKEMTLNAYQKVISQKGIWLAYANTVFYTLVGTLVNLLFTVLGAYPLSKRRLALGGAVSMLIAVTLFINMSGSFGMIPFYLNLRDFGLLDSRLGVIIAFAVSTFYVFLMRTFFQSVPEALEEAAKVDGANDWQVLWRIYLPLSVPSLTTIGLFYAVGRWNSYFWSMIMLQDESKLPLQVLLRKLIVEMKLTEEMLNVGDIAAGISKETIIYATIIVSILPVVLVYPFIQGYFVKGMIVGAIKE